MQGIHSPICSAGDSMAALNISNGISEYICSIVWRPLDGDVAEAGLCGSTVGDIGVGGAVPFGAISRPAGSVATRKSNTSSFSRCAYCSKFGRRVSGADGGASPPSGGGDDAATKESQSRMFSRQMERLQISYAYEHKSSMPSRKQPAASTARAFSGRIRFKE
jgi:hypothetical protein